MEADANSGQLFSKLNGILGHPVGVQSVGELVGVRKKKNQPAYVVSAYCE